MDMTLRWYGEGNDSVTLEQIRQIPGVSGVITALHDIPAGEAWTYEEVMKRKQEVEAKGLKLVGIESINVHEDIKIGLPTRDELIENYNKSLEAVGKAGIHLVCYNFMPVFDWTRTDLAMPLSDGSTALAYDSSIIDGIDASEMFDRIEKASGGFVMPGWEPNRRDEIMDLFDKYKDVTADKLRENFKYFLDGIMPTCEKYKIKMAVHPDDPAWSVFGLPRIIINKENILRLMNMVDNKHNGVTFCSGSYGTNLNNDLPDMIRSLKGRIHFAHVRNLKFHSPTNFEEAAHLSSDGNFDMYEIMKALYETGFDGPIRPDHGRMIWDEVAMPGYGLYDRALGAAYLNGLWEAIEKSHNEKGSLKR